MYVSVNVTLHMHGCVYVHVYIDLYLPKDYTSLSTYPLSIHIYITYILQYVYVVLLYMIVYVMCSTSPG